MLFVDISDNSLSLAFYFDGALQIEAQRTANTARIAQVAWNMKCWVECGLGGEEQLLH